ncbi:hypothetical protein D6764_05150, partial [Candidatus Woesearchaeota archaeon]
VPNSGKSYIETVDAIKVVRDAEGIPVIAHPGAYGLDMAINDLIPIWIDAGAMGIEVLYPSHTPRDAEAYKRIAEEHKLLKTAGTDYHGNRAAELLPDKLKEETQRRYAVIGEIVLRGTDEITRAPLEYAENLVRQAEKVKGHSYFEKYSS